MITEIDASLLEKIADLTGKPVGAFNIRKDSGCEARQSTEHIDITPRADGKQGIDIRFNTEVTDLGTMRGFDEIIVATGSVPRTMPMIPGFEKTMSFTELLKEKKEVGDKVLFIGGGQSSCEAAYDLVLQGKHPIIVEYANDLVAAQATCLANTSFLRDAMEYHKVPTYLESTVTEITDTGCTVKNVKTGESTFVACDNVVNGVGFIPTPVGGKDNKQVHRVGDCVAIGNLRTVIWRAWDVCMKI